MAPARGSFSPVSAARHRLESVKERAIRLRSPVQWSNHATHLRVFRRLHRDGNGIRGRHQIHPMHLHGMPQLVIAKDGWTLPTPHCEDTVLVTALIVEDG